MFKALVVNSSLQLIINFCSELTDHLRLRKKRAILPMRQTPVGLELGEWIFKRNIAKSFYLPRPQSPSPNKSGACVP